jgi:nucleotide-binding universal stress UspA family protein
MRTAVRVANERDADLVLVHSWYLPPTAFTGDYVYGADFIQQFSDDALRGLEAAVAEAGKLGARHVTSKLLTGVPWQQIVEAAQHEPGLDLIVIGTHGRTGISRVLLGSVAEMVVRHAPCPVLTVRLDNDPAPFAHVLCPVDISRPAREAMNLAAELAQPGRRGITLLHVLERPVSFARKLPAPDFHRGLDARSAALLDQWTTDLRAKMTVPVTQMTRFGQPAAQVLALLDEDHTFDLVVMGSHGHTGIARVLLGSVAEEVVGHARCPVLVTHSGNPAHSDQRRDIIRRDTQSPSRTP